LMAILPPSRLRAIMKEEWREKWARRVREGWLRRARGTPFPWEKDFVVKFIEDCRLVDGGAPMFLVSYKGELLKDEEGNIYVLARCYAGGNIIRHMWFRNPPRRYKCADGREIDMVELIERERHEYIDLLDCFGVKEEKIKEILEAPLR